MTNVIYENEVALSGVIVHKYATEKATTLTISTGRSTKVPNYPKVVFFGELAEKAAKEFEQYDNVTVTGNVQSSRRVREEKIYFTQSIFGDSIEATPTAMELAFGVEKSGESPASERNFVKLAGVITDVATPSDGLVRLNIRTVKNGRTSNVRAFHFTRDVGDVMENLRNGDNICAIGTIQTNKKEKDGETYYYENVVLKEIQKVIVEQE